MATGWKTQRKPQITGLYFPRAQGDGPFKEKTLQDPFLQGSVRTGKC